MMNRFTLILLIFSLFACSKSIKSKSTLLESDSSKEDIKLESRKETCSISDVTKYLDNIKYPVVRSKIFNATTLRKNKHDFLPFKDCDYILFQLDSERIKGLDEASYISDYGNINGSRAILIFIQYPNQYNARLFSFQNDSLIDKLTIAQFGFEEPPCDIKFNEDSIIFNGRVSTGEIVEKDTIEIKNQELFIIKNIESGNEFIEVGYDNNELYKIDSLGHFIKISHNTTKKNYYSSIWDCY